ncbi:MAG: hypothetical protein FWE29_04900 [Defluviitaleaceae bacterium]|nr:hypothetical protein [Defluviitaleaceae bacterium]
MEKSYTPLKTALIEESTSWAKAPTISDLLQKFLDEHKIGEERLVHICPIARGTGVRVDLLVTYRA